MDTSLSLIELRSFWVTNTWKGWTHKAALRNYYVITVCKVVRTLPNNWVNMPKPRWNSTIFRQSAVNFWLQKYLEFYASILCQCDLHGVKSRGKKLMRSWIIGNIIPLSADRTRCETVHRNRANLLHNLGKGEKTRGVQWQMDDILSTISWRGLITIMQHANY